MYVEKKCVSRLRLAMYSTRGKTNAKTDLIVIWCLFLRKKRVSCCTSWLDSDRPMEKLSLKYGLTHANRAVHDGKSDVASGHLLHKTFNTHKYIHKKWTNNILDF